MALQTDNARPEPRTSWMKVGMFVFSLLVCAVMTTCIGCGPGDTVIRGKVVNKGN